MINTGPKVKPGTTSYFFIMKILQSKYKYTLMFNRGFIDKMQPSAAIVKIIDDIFHPRSIAVVGASKGHTSFGYQYLQILVESGYRGRLYPVNPQEKEILGIQAYPSLEDIPGEIDYVICCINARLVLDLLAQCSRKKVKAVHLFTGKLSETGDEKALQLEEEIKRQAQNLGIRLIGPNCMGIYYPEERIAFHHELCMEPGTVGAIIQSGGLAGEIVRLAALRGVRFSKVVSYGNAADLGETDFLEYLLWDNKTKIILMYLEGIKDGQRLFKTLRKVTKVKPVIVLKGGRSRAGVKSVASHTASIAGSISTWQVVLRQVKAIQANSLNELIDLCTAFYFLPPITGKRVGVVGGGGGKSVLAGDEYEEAGLEVVPIPDEIIQLLTKMNPKVRRWLVNPVDASILASLNLESVDVLRRMAQSPYFDLLCINSSEDSLFYKDDWIAFMQSYMNEAVKIHKEGSKPVIAVVGNPEIGISQVVNWRWQALFRLREQLIREGIPVFSSAGRAATAIVKLANYYRYQKSRGI